MSSSSSRQGAGPANRLIERCPLATLAQQTVAQQLLLAQAASRVQAQTQAAANATPSAPLETA